MAEERAIWQTEVNVEGIAALGCVSGIVVQSFVGHLVTSNVVKSKS